MKKNILIILLVSLPLFAQSKEESKLSYGVEVDALPYLMGGYYISAWSGIDNYRLRAIYTSFETPSFVIPNGFKDQQTEAFTLLLDCFPTTSKNQFDKWWIGTGLEYWKNNVTNSDNNYTGKYDNLVYTLGGGYIFTVWKNLYLNPWIAGHLLLTGGEKRIIDKKEFEPNNLLYEVSLKIGWKF